MTVSKESCRTEIAGNLRQQRSRYITRENGATSTKFAKFLKITQLTFYASAAIILSGDVCPQPGPLNQVDFDVPSFSIKANGLFIAHLNVRSLTGKIYQLNLVMSSNKGPDIWTFSETWLSNSIQDEEIHIPGYNCKNANVSLKRSLRGITEAFDLKQLITEPTRVTEHSETLIDLVFINANHKVVEHGVFDLGLSDHSLVYCVLKSGRPQVAPKTIKYRSYKNYNKDSFSEDLENIPWHVVFNNTDNVDDYVNTWNKLFLDVVEAHAPTKTRRVRGSSVPWMTSTIANEMRKRDYHLKKAKGNKNSRNWRVYRLPSNGVNCDIKKAKSDYYSNLIQENQGNAKGFWKALKKTLPSSKTSTNISSLRVDDAVVTSDESIVTALNTFFVNIGRKLAEKSPDLSFSNQP
ncbi:hypothetical protein AWC38_SpisGene396 [Stylophora pistillata]|uniref:Endonuclease/exonuclease/phosphatase domain-containing protein n=1 Tax=Stylophora pistillata TaxID=50429 RepID=A0A2B4SZM2_STYPI|nr:hypothetical protein AWC38_SpisGene396 [Stylophora pistillata]